MRGKFYGICTLLLIFCTGSAYRSVLQPHYTLSETSIIIGMEDTFDPYAYVLKNTQPIEEEDKANLVIEGDVPQAIPGEYEITYNQYMKLHITVKDTQAPIIIADSFTWGLGVPFVWNDETLKLLTVTDNYTEETELRKTIQCEHIDTAYLGERTVVCQVSDEAGNVGKTNINVSVDKSSAIQIDSKYNYLNDLPLDDAQKEEIIQVLTYVNQARASASMDPVKLGDIDLMNITYTRAKEVQQLYSHDRPNGELCFTILDDYNYSYKSAGENVAKGQQSALEVIQDWMASDTHRTIIETPEFTKLGVAVMGEGADKIWTLIFVH